MTIKSTLSVVALLAGVAFTGAAHAQTMVGNLEVSEADMTSVQAYCDELALADMNEDTAGENPEDPSNLDSDQSRGDGTTDSDDDAASDVASGTLDLSQIVIDDCRTAGLID